MKSSVARSIFQIAIMVQSENFLKTHDCERGQIAQTIGVTSVFGKSLGNVARVIDRRPKPGTGIDRVRGVWLIDLDMGQDLFD